MGKAFLDDLCTKFGDADREALSAMLKGLEHEALREKPKKPSSKGADAPKTDSSKPPELPLYDLDKAGKMSGLALLRSHAFDIGSTIAFGDKEDDPVWTIVGASGNSAELREPTAATR